MRRAWFVLIAAALALAGCKGTDPKSGDDNKLFGGFAKGNKKDKDKDARPASGPDGWLGDVAKLPGAGTSIPKGSGIGDPKAPGFDAKSAAQDALGGRVLDPEGKPARNIFVRIDPVGGPVSNSAALGIYTKNDGYFFTTGLKAGQTYELTAEATAQDGRKLTGVVQTKVPNPILLIVLRDDLPPPPKGDGTFPPDPRPSDKVSDGSPPKSKDGAWMPGGPVTGTPPATIGGAKPPAPSGNSGGGLPEPDDLTPAPDPKPVKPENIAGTKEPYKPPTVNIPGVGPPVPPLPKLPPNFSPPGGRSSMGTRDAPGVPISANSNKLVLLDTLERPWELDAVRPGSVVLVEFISSNCVPCKQFIPVMKNFQSRYGASGLQVNAVLCDDQPQKARIATAAKYQRDHNLNYAVFVEPGDAGSVRDRFDVEGYPHAVLLDSAGKVLWKGHPGDKTLEPAIKRALGK